MPPATRNRAVLDRILHFPTASRRSPRPGEWSRGKAVTFIVTLAATQSVTLAAREAGMSRKSAYAFRARDASFAHAWDVALGASRAEAAEGDKAERTAPSTSSSRQGVSDPAGQDAARRDLFFARLAATRLGSTPTALGVARHSRAQ
jgi:hypothetical protein